MGILYNRTQSCSQKEGVHIIPKLKSTCCQWAAKPVCKSLLAREWSLYVVLSVQKAEANLLLWDTAIPGTQTQGRHSPPSVCKGWWVVVCYTTTQICLNLTSPILFQSSFFRTLYRHKEIKLISLIKDAQSLSISSNQDCLVETTFGMKLTLEAEVRSPISFWK